MATLGFLFIALIWLAIGKTVADLSRMVREDWYKNWDEKNSISTTVFLRIFLYPVSTLDRLERKNFYITGFVPSYFTYSIWYTILNMLFWPARLGLNIAIWFFTSLLFIFVSFCVIFATCAKNLIKSCVSAIVSSPPEQNKS